MLKDLTTQWSNWKKLKTSWKKSHWKGPTSHFQCFCTLANQCLSNEIHYPHVEKTWTSGEPSQEWAACQNYSKNALITHPGGHKRAQNNMYVTAGLCQDQCSWFNNNKGTGKKWYPWESSKENNHCCLQRTQRPGSNLPKKRKKKRKESANVMH